MSLYNCVHMLPVSVPPLNLKSGNTHYSPDNSVDGLLGYIIPLRSAGMQSFLKLNLGLPQMKQPMLRAPLEKTDTAVTSCLC